MGREGGREKKLLCVIYFFFRKARWMLGRARLGRGLREGYTRGRGGQGKGGGQGRKEDRGMVGGRSTTRPVDPDDLNWRSFSSSFSLLSFLPLSPFLLQRWWVDAVLLPAWTVSCSAVRALNEGGPNTTLFGRVTRSSPGTGWPIAFFLTWLLSWSSCLGMKRDFLML